MSRLEDQGAAIAVDTPLKELLNTLTVIEGCGQAIDRETRNTPDARHKGRLMVRETERARVLLKQILKGQD